MNSENELKEVYKKATEEKNIARKDPANANHFKIASDLYDKASNLSKELIDSKDKDFALANKILSFYYKFESYDSMSGYEYFISKNYDKAIESMNFGISYLRKAIGLTENNINKLNKINNINFVNLLDGWKHSLEAANCQILGNKAKKAMQNNDFISARDNYASLVDKYKEEYKKTIDNKNIEQVYKRIALGNLLAAQANYTTTLTAIINRKQQNDNPYSIMDFEKLFQLNLKTYVLGRDAYEANPEWEQYNQIAQTYRHNIFNLLQNSKNYWSDIYIRYKDNSEVLSIMQQIDSKQYNRVISQKSSRWSAFVQFVMIFLFVSCVAYLFQVGKTFF